jgi:hypothetical protein
VRSSRRFCQPPCPVVKLALFFHFFHLAFFPFFLLSSLLPFFPSCFLAFLPACLLVFFPSTLLAFLLSCFLAFLLSCFLYLFRFFLFFFLRFLPCILVPHFCFCFNMLNRVAGARSNLSKQTQKWVMTMRRIVCRLSSFFFLHSSLSCICFAVGIAKVWSAYLFLFFSCILRCSLACHHNRYI